MRKEVVVAIISGFVLGLLITGGVGWMGKFPRSKVFQGSASVSPTPFLSPSPKKPPLKMIPLTVTEPQDHSIINTASVTLRGKTSPQAVVVVIYPEGENIVEADDKGDFQSVITLGGGANKIKVTAYDKNGDKREVEINLVYSTAKI